MGTGFRSPEGEGFSESQHFSVWERQIELGNLLLQNSDVDFKYWDEEISAIKTSLTYDEQVIWALGKRTLGYEIPPDEII